MPVAAAGTPAPARLPSAELMLLRHAEAERKAASDFERVLTKKGRDDATRAGKRFLESNLRPDLILASPAPRALETARLAALAFGEAAVTTDAAIYDASRETIAKALARHAGPARRILLVGHNPGLSDLASWLSSLPAGWSLSKGATAHIRLRSTWQDMSRGCGRLIDVIEEM